MQDEVSKEKVLTKFFIRRSLMALKFGIFYCSLFVLMFAMHIGQSTYFPQSSIFSSLVSIIVALSGMFLGLVSPIIILLYLIDSVREFLSLFKTDKQSK